MKKWYLWFGLTGVFVVAGVINFFDGRSVIAQVVQVSITIVAAFIQLIWEKRRKEKGNDTGKAC